MRIVTTTKREFIVKTPLGNMRIQAKHSGDYPDDYPGVYIDLMLDNGEYVPVSVNYRDSFRKFIERSMLSMQM